MKIRNPKSEIRSPRPQASCLLECGEFSPLLALRAAKRRHVAARQKAFTIVELMVVVAIIIVLVGIGLAVGPQIVGSGAAKLTKSTLSNLQNIAVEYNVLTNQNVNHLVSVDTPFNWNTDLTQNAPGTGGTARLDNNADGNIPLQSLARFMYFTLNVQSLKKAYATVDPRLIQDKNADGFLEIVDGWQNTIVYVAYVRTPDQGTDNVTDDFLPLRDQPYFASAGPDGKWGHARADVITNAQLAPYKLAGESDADARVRLLLEASDNLYSFGTLER